MNASTIIGIIAFAFLLLTGLVFLWKNDVPILFLIIVCMLAISFSFLPSNITKFQIRLDRHRVNIEVQKQILDKPE